jgi:predicted enzyme related to lactoylglutathione lyase
MSAADERRARSACWIDLGTSDPAQTSRFYEALFGWNVAGADADGYRLAALDDHLVAAFGPAADPGAPYWTVYLHADDAHATARSIVGAGGTIVSPPAPVGDSGVASIAQDLNGATFALWQPTGHRGSWVSKRPGTFAGFELTVEDIGSTERFWNATAGWTFDDSGAINCRGTVVGTWRPSASNPMSATSSPWLINLRAGDVCERMTCAIALGATVIDTNRGVLRDPAGAAFKLVA